MKICICCGLAPATGPDHYCPACERSLGLELARGLGRLERYLASFATFDEWLSTRGSGAETGSSGVALGQPHAYERVQAESYLPRGYSILSGAIADGSLASLHGSCARLAVAAARHDGHYVAELVTYASIETFDQAVPRGLAVEVKGGVSAPGVGMALSLYNWRTKRWDRLKWARPAGEEGSSLIRLAHRSARDFVSPTGEVCLGMRAEHACAFHTLTGLVRFTVET